MKSKQKGEVNKTKKILSFLPGILYNILVFFCVILIAIIVMQRLSDSNRSIGGYKIFKVISGSMVPKYEVGEVVICKETPVTDIKVGNAIVYRGKIGDLNGRIVMHEVVDIHYDEKNELKFYAKGLNNSKGDPEISEDQIMGVVKIKSGILTLLYRLATSIYSAFIIITILVINVFVSFKSGNVEEDEDDKKDKKKQKLSVEEDKTLKENEQNQKSQIKDVVTNQEENTKEENTTNSKIKEQDKKEINKKAKELDKKEIDKKVKELDEKLKEIEKEELKNKKQADSTKENKEKIVIDSKEESDKIENEEKTTGNTKKSTTKKGATASVTKNIADTTSKKTEAKKTAKTKKE